MRTYQARRVEAISPKGRAKRECRSHAAQWGLAGPRVLECEHAAATANAFLCLKSRSTGAALGDNLRAAWRLSKGCRQGPEESAGLVDEGKERHGTVSRGLTTSIRTKGPRVK